MITQEQAKHTRGYGVISGTGEKIGTVADVYVDNRSERPAWVTVRSGMLGTTESFVPLDQAELTDDGLVVPYDRDRVTQSPRVSAADGDLSPEDEAALYEHYGLAYTDDEGVQRTDHVPPPRYRKHVVTEDVSTSVPVTQQHLEDAED